MELIVATTNRGKFTEIQEALRKLPLKLIFLGDLPNPPRIEEDQLTFEANALKKARTISQWAGKAVLADDSGLVIPALDGRPGIHSARYAGLGSTDEQNRQKLLKEMKGIPEGKRGAFFVCVLAVVTPSGQEQIFEGRCDGKIGYEERGSLGFGYDPLFFLPSLGKTMAELSLEGKNRLSHRGLALARLKNEWTFIQSLGSLEEIQNQ